ncbi:metal-dependent hydrolase [Paenibacillus sambharensis]|uniref:Metal-dependent hydrolase n=1 Tax=Paenibacillus sambharensis TaxID=1803190 RepID=A0A2W1L369_9BACL|nr:metal-dependent hydrolase [Paenibacillus sambharensis]PZD93786.1 metal-dependent hydrolase [Paenibacillus sambharensis]
MDTVTHTLFGLTLYGSVDKTRMSRKEKGALLLAAVGGSQIPDIDVISAWWDTQGRYQMWHRGITHSVFLVPVWAALITLIVRLLFKVRGWFWFGLAALAVLIHDVSDLFNAWGTGFLEPFSAVRVTFGTIPIVDVLFWIIMGGAFLFAKFGRGRWRSHHVFRIAWGLIALHVAIQTSQGYAIHNSLKEEYEQIALSADFVPGVFTVIGKQDNIVEIRKGTLWSGMEEVAVLTSKEDADLDKLFAANPKARTLYEWSPFVVIVEDGSRLGLYDPRFYRNGQSFLFEYMDHVEDGK